MLFLTIVGAVVAVVLFRVLMNWNGALVEAGVKPRCSPEDAAKARAMGHDLYDKWAAKDREYWRARTEPLRIKREEEHREKMAFLIAKGDAQRASHRALSIG